MVILPKKKSQSRRKTENSASCTSGVYGDFPLSLCFSERSRETVYLFSVLMIRGNRTFVALSTAIGLVAVACYFPLQKTQLLLEQELFWSEKRYGQRQYDVLLIGDSTTHEGVSPEILKEYIPNATIYNFGFIGVAVNQKLLETAEKRLKKNGKRIFVFGFSPRSLILKRKDEHFSRIIKAQKSLHFFRRMGYSIRGIQEGIKFHINSGFKEMCLPRNKAEIESMTSFYKAAFQKQSSFCLSDFEQFVQNLRWCKKNNIRVVAYRPIMHPEMDELMDQLSGVHFGKIKRTVLDEGFIWLDRPIDPLLEQIQRNTYDNVHLNAEGAELFSNWLGQELAELDWFKENQQTSETEK